MKVTPKAGPSSPQMPTAKVAPIQSARDRAISKLMHGAPAEAPMAIPNVNPSPGVELSTAAATMEASEAKIHSQLAPESSNSVESKGQEYTNDSSSESTKEVTKTTEEPMSMQFAALARKEKALRARSLAQENALKAREEAIKAKEQELSSKYSVDKTNYIDKSRLLEDPFSVLNELGLNYDKLTEAALSAPSQGDLETRNLIKSLSTEIENLKRSQEDSKKAQEKQLTDSYQQALAQIKSEANQLVSSGDTFETIRETGSVDDVVELIKDVFDNGIPGVYSKGTLLSVEQAAQQVEDYLVEESLKLYNRVNKIKQKLNPPKAEASLEQKLQEEPKQNQAKTLTNSMTTSRPLSARERAIAILEGKNKK